MPKLGDDEWDSEDELPGEFLMVDPTPKLKTLDDTPIKAFHVDTDNIFSAFRKSQGKPIVGGERIYGRTGKKRTKGEHGNNGMNEGRDEKVQELGRRAEGRAQRRGHNKKDE